MEATTLRNNSNEFGTFIERGFFLLCDSCFFFRYEQSDGQKREEAGVLKPVEGAEAPAISVTGSYEFTDPTGQRYRVDYTADERGYRPTVTKL